VKALAELVQASRKRGQFFGLGNFEGTPFLNLGVRSLGEHVGVAELAPGFVEVLFDFGQFLGQAVFFHGGIDQAGDGQVELAQRREGFGPDRQERP